MSCLTMWAYDGSINYCCVQKYIKKIHILPKANRKAYVRYFQKLIIYGLLYENKGGHEVHDIVASFKCILNKSSVFEWQFQFYLNQMFIERP